MALTYGGSLAATVPTVSVTAGPTYATYVNAVLNEIVACLNAKVTPSGFLMNAALDILNYDINNTGKLGLQNRGSLPSAASVPVSLVAYGGNLYYADNSGNMVQITSGGALNAAAIGGWTGDFGGANPARATFTDATGLFALTEDTNKYGKLAIADLLIREYNNASANAITLKSPAALAGAYSLTLPAALPGATSLVQLTSAGVLSGTLTPSGLTSIGTGTLTATGAVSGGTVATAEADIRHAAQRRHISAAAGMPTNAISADPNEQDWDLVVGIGGNGLHWSSRALGGGLIGQIVLPLNTQDGETLTTATCFIRDTAGGVMTMSLWKGTMTSSAPTQLGATQSSAGAAGSDQSLTVSGLSTAIGADETCFMVISQTANTAGQRVFGGYFSVTRP